MMKPNRLQAIFKLNNTTEFSFDDEDNILEWDISSSKTGITQPTSQEIDAKLVELQTEWTANQYQQDRAAAYDSIGNQLDMLMKDMKNNTTTHQESCEAVKNKYPKS